MDGYLDRAFPAVQRCLVPRAANFTEPQRLASSRLIRQMLSTRPASARAKLVLFLRFLDLLSLARGATSFARLRPEQQHRLLHGLFDSRFAILRKGFWGINTLARLGVYGQPSVYPDLSYRLKPLEHDSEKA